MPRNKNYTKGKKTIVMIISRGGGGDVGSKPEWGILHVNFKKVALGFTFRATPLNAMLVV